MPNTLLTPDDITREAVRVLHQKCNFIGSINRQYDDSFAKEGAKIGDTLRVRLPNQYTVRTGKTLSTQDTTETQVPLAVATQKGVDMVFSTAELTMDLDNFSKRIIEPAMAVLAANIENDALSMLNDVYQQVNNIGSALTFKNIMEGRKELVDALAPSGDWQCRLNTQDNVDLVDVLKGLFHDDKAVTQQYREGVMGKTAGFTFAENTLLSNHTSGTDDGTGDYLVNDAGAAIADGDTALPVDTGTGTLTVGDVFTIAGVNRVHPETKDDTGVLQTFVVTSAYAGGAGNIAFSPALQSTGASQNITALPADNAAVTKQGGASAVYGRSVVYAPDAFAFATADLVKPGGVDFCSRQVFDGISMRVVRQYDINTDNIPARLDVLYGYKTIRAQLAALLAAN